MSDQKATKKEAQYGPGNGTVRCYLCLHFEKPNACTKVEGRIKPDDACKYWERAR